MLDRSEFRWIRWNFGLMPLLTKQLLVCESCRVLCRKYAKSWQVWRQRLIACTSNFLPVQFSYSQGEVTRVPPTTEYCSIKVVKLNLSRVNYHYLPPRNKELWNGFEVGIPTKIKQKQNVLSVETVALRLLSRTIDTTFIGLLCHRKSPRDLFAILFRLFFYRVSIRAMI